MIEKVITSKETLIGVFEIMFGNGSSKAGFKSGKYSNYGGPTQEKRATTYAT